MSKKLRPKKISGKSVHIRRQSPTLHRAKRTVTILLVAALVLSVGLWVWARELRLRRKEGAVQVSVGSSVMAHIVPQELGKEEIDLYTALDCYGVRPSSMQTVLLMGDEFSEETTGQDLSLYTLEMKKHEILLWKENTILGILEWVALPDGAVTADGMK